MARFTFKASDEYALKVAALGKNSKAMAEKAIKRGAGIVADELRKNLEKVSAVDDMHNLMAYKKRGKAKLSIKQKKGLLESFGITDVEMDSKGFYNAKLGFDEYNSIRTKKYPKGQPNQLIARALEGGTSFMDAQPFVRPAVNATRKAAKEEMQKVIDEECAKIMNK